MLTVEERSSAENESVSDIRIGFLTARVVHHVPLHLGLHQVPLTVGHVVGQVRGVPRLHQVHLKPIVGPAGELHGAQLLVEREILDIDSAGGLEDCGAEPRDVAVIRDDGVGAGEAGAVLPVRVVVQDDVGLPDGVGGEPDHRDVVLLGRVPHQVRVLPLLGEPAVGGQHLVPLVLEHGDDGDDHYRIICNSPRL